jgi:hypothetical protein
LLRSYTPFLLYSFLSFFFLSQEELHALFTVHVISFLQLIVCFQRRNC